MDAVLHIDWLLRQAACRQQVALFWNANNTFGFSRIPWGRLAQATTIITVSRYMKRLVGSRRGSAGDSQRADSRSAGDA